MQVAPRLHVLLAKDSPLAVVIRRGPSRHACTIGWDRSTDQFRIGQWMYGRIYERRADISPDGRHLIYFAMNGRWSSRMRGSWTAISRAPYLKAVTLWSKGDCWNGGGLFTSSDEYWLNGDCGHELVRDEARLGRLSGYPWKESYGGECAGVYYLRLQRDGWRMKYTAPSSGGTLTLFEKPLPHHWTLRKFAHATTDHPVGRGCYFDEHELHNSRTGESRKLQNWEWADLDGERLVWAVEGKLLAGLVKREGIGVPALLHDFNAMAFERLVAPY